MKNSLLVYEPCRSNLPYAAFMLTLNNIRCTHARTPEEGRNWLLAAQQKVVSFDLVLVSALCFCAAEDEFFSDVAQRNLPLVLVQRDDDSEFPMLVPQQILCPEDDLLDWLSSYFELEEDW